MALDPISAALEIGGKVIDRIWPDPAQAAAAKLELLKLEKSGELAQMTGQMEINKVEAASADPFTSRARPFIMWVCGLALLYASMIDPLARFVATVFFHYAGAFPAIDTTITMQVLFGLLGLGGYRTVEKIKGVAK